MSCRFHNSSQSIDGEERHHGHLKADEKRLLRNCFLSFTNQQVLLNSMLQGNHFPTEAAFSPFAEAYWSQVNFLSLSLSGWSWIFWVFEFISTIGWLNSSAL